MKTWQKCSLRSVFEDAVVYRNLEPLDRRLPGLHQVWSEVGLASYYIPRKAKDEDYVRVLLHFLQLAQALRREEPLTRLLYLGNRQVRDQATLSHFRQNSPLPLFSLLCEEEREEERRVIVRDGGMLANRWDAVVDWQRHLRTEGVSLDPQSALVVDMDKTIIGARGRNAESLNKARLEGVLLTAKELLGTHFQEARFQAVYGEVNQPRYHFFTEDNQDYITYISLIVSAQVYPMEDLLEDLAYGAFADFPHFVEITGERLRRRPMSGLAMVQKEITEYLSRGDPTAFKRFRSKQFEATLARIDSLPDGVDEQTLLAEEITITREVLDLLQFARERGALLFSISDRPDESLIPSPELARRGYRPVHELPCKIVGKPVYQQLAAIRLSEPVRSAAPADTLSR